jgi:hypothetical protein
LEGVEDGEYCDGGLENGLCKVLEASDVDMRFGGVDLWRGVEMWRFRREVEDGRGATARIQGIRGGIVGDVFEVRCDVEGLENLKIVRDLQIS